MNISSRRVGQVLGLSEQQSDSPMRLIRSLERGLPVQSLARVCNFLAPQEPKFREVFVSRASFARRQKQRRLSMEESERLERAARVWALASDVWKDDAKAQRFLLQPHAMLEGQRPIDVAVRTDVGARTVEGILGRLKYGSAA
jgi:putative toxin-antitoxin system antitoxin component (TIGR02293 family)